MDYKEKYEALLANIKAYHARFGHTCNLKKELEECVPELRESEDERIRKHLVEIVEMYWGKTNDPDKAKDLAYLEKQKPSAEEVLIKAGLKPYKDGNQWCILIGDNIQEGICGFGDTIDDALYHLLREAIAYQKEQKPADIPSSGSGAMGTTPPAYKLDVKPAEWSEEDENALKRLHELIDYCVMDAQDATDKKEWLNAKLKSLRPQPHWKPSEEQMEALKYIINSHTLDAYHLGQVQRIYQNLKKLM